MAHIHIPYTYTNYPESKLATRVDKFCHMPSRNIELAMLGFLYGLYVNVSLCGFDLDKLETGPSVIILPLILAAIGLVVGVSLKSACDDSGLSMRIARWDVERRQKGLGYPVWFKLTIAAVILVLALPGALGAVITAKNAAYHKTMSPLSGSAEIAVTGEKITALETESYRSTYSGYGIPENLLARTPEEARYILRCKHSEEITGYYSENDLFTAGAPKAIRRSVSVELYDRSCDTVIAETTFTGGEPPRSTSSDKDQYGSAPSEESIRYWVADAYSGVTMQTDDSEQTAPRVATITSMDTVSNSFSSYGVPPELRSANPSTAAYVLRCTVSQSTGYHPGTAGVQLPYKKYTCDVVIVPYGSNTILAEASFSGKAPAGNAVEGAQPSEEEIMAWVAEVYPTLPDMLESGGIGDVYERMIAEKETSNSSAAKTAP